MQRFSDDITSAECSESLTITFGQRSSFEQARRSWDWVNQQPSRSFVLVSDPFFCGTGNDREPWLVVRTAADASRLVIHLEATKKEWSEVTYKYKIDFGAVGTSPDALKKRLIPISKDESFKVPLEMPFPPSLFSFRRGDDKNYVDFQLNCVDCGLTGMLLFEGHIHGAILPLSLDRFEITMKPVDVKAALNLEFLLSGSYKPDLHKDFDLFGIPILFPWRVKGILELGPQVRLQAGFALESLEGKAKLTTGFSVAVPENSILGLDLTHLNPADSDKLVIFEGWEPTFETKEPTLDARVTATLKTYLQISPAFDFVVFGQRGVTAGFPFKFLDLHMTMTAGHGKTTQRLQVAV